MYIFCLARNRMIGSWIIFLVTTATFFQECQAVCKGTTCGECISSDYSCSWCLMKNFTAPRCQPRTNLMSAGCEDQLIEDPKSSLSFQQDEEVRDGGSIHSHAIQVQPQKVHIKTRLRKEHTFSMTFRAANNYPVDLYFLFDNSLSMESHIQSLSQLADDIGKSIGNISSNYRMAYGVFQDKVILPYTDTNPVKLENPCASRVSSSSAKKCARPFEFKHLLSMTADINKFSEKVRQTKVTGNLDHPEGSADAIMQVVTCKNLYDVTSTNFFQSNDVKSEIGWRAIGRKLLIFASNDRFHLAGDGRLAGIVIPNDGHCHLDGTGNYLNELLQDYPSVGQLTDTVEKNEVHIIFAVTKSQDNLFMQLSNRIPQSTVQFLPENTSSPTSQNIKEIIEKKYKAMVSEVEIVHNKVKGVDIQIKARSSECERQGTNKCKGLQIGTPIQFDVKVKVTECPSSPEERIRKVIIHPASLKSDQMELDIETVCECDCTTDQSTWEVDSDVCNSGNGTLKCGLCDCHGDKYGQFCECDLNELDSSKSGCIKPGENSTIECSGAGKCECGVCQCDDGYSGPYCECNDQACGSSGGEVCGGVRGRCVCGECICEEGYTGNTCDCPTSNATCLFDDKICNDVGTCECGVCKNCKNGFIGKYCDRCYLCGNSVCDVPLYRDCAECALSSDDDCPLDCPKTVLVDSITDTTGSDVCSLKQPDGCFLKFRITSTDTNATLLVQKTTVCPEPVNILPIALGVVGGVVAIGLLVLLLWKILTSLFDRIEYSRFQEDLKNCKWAQQDNPFYKGATTTYKNPMLDTSEPIDK